MFTSQLGASTWQMQKLWYNTNYVSGHEKSPSKHEIFVNNKTQNLG
jgi:hypothetical protein